MNALEPNWTTSTLSVKIGNHLYRVTNHNLIIEIDRKFSGGYHQNFVVSGNASFITDDEFLLLNDPAFSTVNTAIDYQRADLVMLVNQQTILLFSGLALVKALGVNSGTLTFLDSDQLKWKSLAAVNINTLFTATVPFTGHHPDKVHSYGWYADRTYPEVNIQFPLQPFGIYPKQEFNAYNSASQAGIQHQPPCVYLAAVLDAIAAHFSLPLLGNLWKDDWFQQLLLTSKYNRLADFNWNRLGKVSFEHSTQGTPVLDQHLNIITYRTIASNQPKGIVYQVLMGAQYQIELDLAVTNGSNAAVLNGYIEVEIREPQSGFIYYQTRTNFSVVAGFVVTPQLDLNRRIEKDLEIYCSAVLSHGDCTWIFSAHIQPTDKNEELDLSVFLPTMSVQSLLSDLAKMAFSRLMISENGIELVPEQLFWNDPQPFMIETEWVDSSSIINRFNLDEEFSIISFYNQAEGYRLRGLYVKDSILAFNIPDEVGVDIFYEPNNLKVVTQKMGGQDRDSPWSLPSPMLLYWKGKILDGQMPIEATTRYGLGPIGYTSAVEPVFSWPALENRFNSSVQLLNHHLVEVVLNLPFEAVLPLQKTKMAKFRDNYYRIEGLQIDFNNDFIDRIKIKLSLRLPV